MTQQQESDITTASSFASASSTTTASHDNNNNTKKRPHTQINAIDSHSSQARRENDNIISTSSEPLTKKRRLLNESLASSSSSSTTTTTSSPSSQQQQHQHLPNISTTSPFINPQSLHYDLPKSCCETLQEFNIYCCLTCGKYLRGGVSMDTPAMRHSLMMMGSDDIGDNVDAAAAAARNGIGRFTSSSSSSWRNTSHSKKTSSSSSWRRQQKTLQMSSNKTGSVINNNNNNITTNTTSSSSPHGHNLFIHIETGKFWILPQRQQISPSESPLLKRIQWNLNPHWDSVSEYDQKLASHYKTRQQKYWLDVNQVEFVPGARVIVANNAAVRCVVSLLCNMRRIRNYFMTHWSQFNNKRQPLCMHFGELLRRIWNDQSFRATLSMSPLGSAIEQQSQGKFKVFMPAADSNANLSHTAHDNSSSSTPTHPLDFFNWFTHQMHMELTGSKMDSPFSCFHGKLKMRTQIFDTKQGSLMKELKKSVPFRFLSCEVPFQSLYKDAHGRQIIPEVSLEKLLEKYNGEKETTRPSMIMPGNVEKSRYAIRKLPEYVVIHLKRSTQDTSLHASAGKNKTLVTFPTRHFDLQSIVGKKSTDSTAKRLYNFVGSVVENNTEELQTLDKKRKETNSSESYYTQLHQESIDQYFRCDSVSCSTVTEESISVGNSVLVVFRRI